jgi:hypothetical protein
MKMATDTTRGEGRNYKKRTRWQKYHCFALSRIEEEKKIRIISVHENSNRHHKEEKKQLRKELPHCVPTRLQKKKKNARRPWQQVKKTNCKKGAHDDEVPFASKKFQNEEEEDGSSPDGKKILPETWTKELQTHARRSTLCIAENPERGRKKKKPGIEKEVVQTEEDPTRRHGQKNACTAQGYTVL